MKLWPCSAEPAILPKTEFTLDLPDETLKTLTNLQEKLLGGNFFSVKLQVGSLSLQFH